MRTVVPVARDVETIERLQRRFRLALGGAKRRKIVAADEHLCGLVHRGFIERTWHAPSAVDVECEVSAAIANAIAIVPLDGRKARIEIWRDVVRVKHGDGMWTQVCVEGVAHGAVIPVLGKIDMRDLAERVHAGIGAAGALNGGALSRECRNRVHQGALHRGAVVLDLPAHIRRAVIFDGELVTRHDCSAERDRGRNGRTAQEFVRLHRPLPGAL